MPSINSIARSLRLYNTTINIIEEYMLTYDVTFNRAVNEIIQNTQHEESSSEQYIDISGERVDDHGKLRSEFEVLKTKLPKMIGRECIRCGSKSEIVYHHIKPLSRGGNNDISNIVPLCKTCHDLVHGWREKRNKPIKPNNDNEINALKKENSKLREKIDILKKALSVLSE